ncbi:NAD(P)/FAD-dependent oxidoreductase [Nocardia bovistercoris]|uniref:FAD-dependent oxidoreductase n=1 Tax=Nocardia bovistercoris TaxID=2785916 RepID=A0A931IHE3_9NOCA|nr:FAD-dependent oxidoreductase [Nocardia bovistercoris]
MERRRVVIAGLGDMGVLTAIRLARYADVVGVSVKPALVSGRELGLRLSTPSRWAREFFVPFDRLRGLDKVRTVHAALTGVDLAARKVFVDNGNGTDLGMSYDALVISTGVANGFWRQPTLQSEAQVRAEVRAANERMAAASSVIVVGGGAAAVSTAANLARTWPATRVDLYFPGARALTDHHPRTWESIRRRLDGLGVGVHPGHRAVVPEEFLGDEITAEPVTWSTGQPEARADAVVWAIGRARPNTGWLPAELLDERGFVRVTPELTVPGHPEVFAVGDVAATDPMRTSARNQADALVARNVRALFDGRRPRAYRPPSHHWGSVLGPQPDGFQIFTPGGRVVRLPAWSVDRVLNPWIVHRGIYRGIRHNDPLPTGE